MALALQPRLLPVLRTATAAATARTFTTSLARRNADDSAPSKSDGAAPPQPKSSAPKADDALPNLPPQRKQKTVDPLAKAARPKHGPHPYDATKSSIADLIGASMTTSFASPDMRPQQPRIPIRAVPSTGRTVHISGGVNPARAFAMLNQRVIGNRVQTIFNRQRFYERPGLKKKRLRMSRWRSRFKTGFQSTVVRVQELVRQGW